MGNADANEQFFAEERAALVRAIREAVEGIHGPLLRKVDVIAKIEQAAKTFEKETYEP